jgi:4'-phosphopantetheinyl transferase
MTDIPLLPSQPLPDSATHIWCASLSVTSTVLAHYSSCLAPDEKARANRFYFEADRNRYIAGRGLLRTILGSYLQRDPAQIEFVYGPYGKPALKPVQGHKTLEFNLSHSKDLAVYAFNLNCKLGVDVEYIKPMSDMDSFAVTTQ